jgi:hypothetical protein
MPVELIKLSDITASKRKNSTIEFMQGMDSQSSADDPPCLGG